jgi:transposase
MHDVAGQARFLCSDVSDRESARWTSVASAGIDPTNSAAERALRPAVLERKGCFGAGNGGNVFVARILTVRETYRQQECHRLSFLTETVVAYRNGLATPSLLAGV